MSVPAATAVIVTYNSAAVVGECLDVLPPMPCIVVDNDSDDDTLEVVVRIRPDAQIVRQDENVGFGRAANVGFARVATPYAILLNPDAFCPAETVNRLLAAAEAYPDAGIIVPLVLDQNGNSALPVMGPAEHTHRPAETPADGPFCTWFVTAAAWLCPMDSWNKVGGFDPAIFMYGEDVDMCLRMTARRLAMIVVPGAGVRHLGGRSSRPSWRIRWRKDWHMTWGHLYVGTKWRNEAAMRAEARRIIIRHGLRALLYVPLLRPRRMMGNLAKAHAAFAFLRGRPAWPGRPQSKI
ncbi:MAG: glycosyltransferase family 2 protein [Alphaproteobacteria bacterium]|nr:glycosyltransferase family 2 protein [Alphaproteobacteria bacterium]